MHADSIKLSIITPTYNRIKTLPRLFSSLQSQTNRQYQWILMDDGSTDGTKEWFEANVKGNANCEYHRQKNSGKHVALNNSHPYIKGEYVLILDSDDVLQPDGVEIVLNYWDRYKENKDVVGIVFQRGTIEGNPFDRTIKGEKMCSIIEMTNHGMHGDHCETVRTSEFLKYPFPEFSGEKFLGEAWLWISIGGDGKYVYTDSVIYLCQYLEGGLSRSGRKLRLQSPSGGIVHAEIMMQEGFKLTIRIKNAILLCAYSCISAIPRRELFKKAKYKLLTRLSYPAGKIVATYWKQKYMR